ANPTTGPAPLAVVFSSAGSSDPDGSIQSRSWAFGDGGTSTSQNPSHSYNSPGTYAAVLTVKDNGGLTSSATVTITANANQPPVAVAAANATSGVVPLAVAFSGDGSSAPAGGTQGSSWGCGDGG